MNPSNEPEKILFVFAGPNGSGKSTLIDKYLENGKCPKNYICPDNFVPKNKREDRAAYLEAMIFAEEIRFQLLDNGYSFTFETVFSTKSKLDFLITAKNAGYKITTIYMTTADPKINFERVEERKKQGGHGVPKDKLYARYEKSMGMIAEIISVSDSVEIFDNSYEQPFQVFEKNKFGELALLNKEKRKEWVNTYVIEPLASQMIEIQNDLTCEETENMKNK